MIKIFYRHGLSLSEALHKQHTIDRIDEEDSIVPAKEKFRYELLEQIKSGDFEESDVGDILKYELEPQKPQIIDIIIFSIIKFWTYFACYFQFHTPTSFCHETQYTWNSFLRSLEF